MSLRNSIKNLLFKNSASYWEKRYKTGGNSGAGSYGEKAAYKARFINRFIEINTIKRIVEIGCGDGNQLSMLNVENYTGLDISRTVVSKCKMLFGSDTQKSFFVLNDIPETELKIFSAELALSLDVIYHLVEDSVYNKYMEQLFSLAEKWVIIYAWNIDSKQKFHVRHRKFSDWIETNRKDYELVEKKISDKGFCDFFVYRKKENIH